MTDGDEAFVLPDRMRGEVIGRRGEAGRYVPPEEALEAYRRRQHDARVQATDSFLVPAMTAGYSDAALLATLRAPGFGELEQASPLQTALDYTLIQAVLGLRTAELGFVESWFLGRGPAFAFEALAEAYDVRATYRQGGMVRSRQGFVRGGSEEMWVPDLWMMARRLRELLAGTSEAEYRAAGQAAEGYRGGTRTQRALTSFLFPERTGWVDADIAELVPPGHDRLDLTCHLLVSAITRDHQIAAFAQRQRWLVWPRDTAPLATLLASVGAAATPLLTGWLDDGHHSGDDRSRVLALISELGSDASVRALIDRIAGKDGQHAVLATGRRFPRRTLRLLAETDPASDGGDGSWARHVSLALRLVANTHGRQARALIPELDPAARSRLQAALEPPRRLRQATWAEMPPILVSPPWLEPGTKAKPPVVTGLAAPDGAAVGVPKRMPPVPPWAEPYALPQIARIGGGSALPPKAVRHVVQMLSISKPGAPYAGLEAVREACGTFSLRDFAWALFENWQLAGYPRAHAWAFDSLRWFGDDDTVRRLAPLIQAWPGENGHARAVAGLDVLAAIGGDTALTALYAISQRVKFKALRDRAGERIAEIAGDLGLTSEQLGDRLVPDLGLDPDGTLTLDFGPRRFVVGFDELLKPFVRDESGQRLKALPKPGVKDDAQLARAATEAFSALKKTARAVTADQIARLEEAMCLRRRWSMLDFCSYFVVHPLIRHLVRRLVWGSYGADGSLLATFRIAEDLTFADVEDEPFKDDIEVVGLVHPLEIGELIPRWSEVLADYEILQPFEQLGRAAYALTDAERGSTNLRRFQDAEIPVGRLVGLTRRGWRRGEVGDNGVERYVLRPLPGGRALVADLEPGIVVGRIGESGPQELSGVWIARDGAAGGSPRTGAGDRFGTLDIVTASEILRDLTEVTGATGVTGVTAQ